MYSKIQKIMSRNKTKGNIGLAKKDTFLLFSPITLSIRISWVYWLSTTWYNIDGSQLMSWFDRYQLQLVYPTMEHHPARNLQHETFQITLDMFDQSRYLLHILHKSFFVFQLCCYLSWNYKAVYAKKHCLFSPIFNIKVATQEFTSFDKFFYCTLIWQLYKIVLNEVKDN